MSNTLIYMIKEDYSVLLEKDFRLKFFDAAISKFGSQAALAEYLSNKIKNRKITRENIKEWLKGKHRYGWDILTPVNVIRRLGSINSISFDDIMSHAVKFNPEWEDPRKQCLLVQKRRILIIKKFDGLYLDLATILPVKSLEAMRSRKSLPLFVKIDNNFIKLWSGASWKKSEINLVRHLRLDDLFFKGCAIYISEGVNKINRGACNSFIGLGNSEPSIINLFLKWLNSYLINYKLSYRLEYNGVRVNGIKLKEFWSKKIDIESEFIKIYLRKNYKSSLINNFGTLNIRIDNTVLKSFVINLLKVSRRLTLNNKGWQISYIKGLLASEGSVNNYNHTLKAVTIGSTNPDERIFIKALLKKLGLKYCEGKNQLNIINWNSFYKLFTYDAFEIEQINNYSKKARFIIAFKNHQKTKKLIKLFPFKHKIFTAYDWQKYYGLKYYISAHKFLNSLVKEDLLKTKLLKNKKYYSINKYRLKELEKIWSL